MPRTSIANTDNVIDSRDVIARIAELEAQAEETESCEYCNGDGLLPDSRPDADTELRPECPTCEGSGQGAVKLDEYDAAELAALTALADEASESPDWGHGETLIADSYFQDYARETASDLYGKEIDDAHWPFDHIDWSAAADALKQDYTEVDFDGVAYWIRS